MIRDATWTDIVRILATRRRQHVLRLNPPYSIIQPEALLTDLLRAQSPAPRRRAHTLVYVEDGDLAAYVQARCRWQRHDEWTISALATTEHDAEPLWRLLLAEVVHQAGEGEITRVFAKLALDDALLELFRGVGFAVYAQERVWGNLYLTGLPPKEARRGPLRTVERRDAFDLLQLYRQVTPRIVQQAEALTSKQWQTGPRFSFGGLAARAYLWDNGAAQGPGPGPTFAPHGVGGWVRLLTGSRGHWITTLYRPEQRTLAREAMDYVLWQARKSAPKPMYVALREYQSEIEPLLEERGFHLLTEQALLVKYTAVLAQDPVPAFALQRVRRLVIGDWTLSRAGSEPRNACLTNR